MLPATASNKYHLPPTSQNGHRLHAYRLSPHPTAYVGVSGHVTYMATWFVRLVVACSSPLDVYMFVSTTYLSLLFSPQFSSFLVTINIIFHNCLFSIRQQHMTNGEVSAYEVYDVCMFCATIGPIMHPMKREYAFGIILANRPLPGSCQVTQPPAGLGLPHPNVNSCLT
ncbi:hypothetical protein VN97_g9644 [Penicillium thymicola]|uniref:Uncharacterized protein n=1 Tax=Penicillium thymicola TaxID=293382 RepID=A0AAI9TBC0_PENTH|nr:hypothetical protein VN97_g9644 [Penicillium thymicola]